MGEFMARSGIRWSVVVMAIVLFFGFAYYFALRVGPAAERLTPYVLTSSSPPGGSYQQALRVLFDTLAADSTDLNFRITLHDKPTRGELETIEQMRRGDVDLGLIQGNVNVHSVLRNMPASEDAPGIATVAQLYDEVFVLFTRHPVTTMVEFCDAFRNAAYPVRTGSLGPGSQVHLDLNSLLEFYRCPAAAETQYTMDYKQAAAALAAGQIDLAFMVAGYRNPDIRALAATPGVRLLALTDLEALTRNMGGIERYVVPSGLFGARHPAHAVQTVSTPAVLVVSRRIDDAIVYDMARFMFSHEGQLEASFPQFDVDIPTANTGAPFHPAALRAHRQQTFGFYERYATLLQAALSLLGAVTALITILFQFLHFLRERRKARQAPT